MHSIVIQDEEIYLLPEKALWWPAQKVLIVADLHWGKSAHFRKNGIAIPANTQRQDEKRLADLIQQHKAEHLIIAGDLFHSKANNETDAFQSWRKAHLSLQISLVIGNHDILPEDTYTSLNVHLHKDAYHYAPFLISHYETDTPHFTIHGHIHPAIRMNGNGRQSIRLSCFAQTKNSLILPAFGQFTGTHTIEEKTCKHIYVIADNKILQWK